jgi:tRNA modification GTPase
VSLLTPPAAGAIATVEVRGLRAWESARRLFKPAGRPLPLAPDLGRYWFGTLGSDEVVLTATAADAVEVHCHGGRRVVRWVIEQFLTHGCAEATADGPTNAATDLLQRAPTLRTASVLLDQSHGAFAAEVRRVLALLESDPQSAYDPLRRLAALGDTVGRHLVEPWKVVVAGPPNVGKSSLVNALAGYQRSVVSEVAGTTRDAVSVRTAFDGWPVELIDTAGLRGAAGLEAEGIDRARRVLKAADLVVWVMDASTHEPTYPDAETEGAVGLPTALWVLAMNKADRSVGWPPNQPPGAIHLSAATGANVPLLADWITSRLVPDPPAPGAAVPFNSQLADTVGAAHAALQVGRPDEAARLLRQTVAESALTVAKQLAASRVTS